MAYVKVARTEEVPVGHGTLVETGGQPVAVFNAGGGRFYACGALCPHEEGPLNEGWLEGDLVVCPWHGYDFELETGRCRVDPELSIPVYRVKVDGDAIEVDLP
jgi:nitrite reductase (NADH) small subunit